MVSRHGILKYLVLLVVFALVLTACERPLSNGGDESENESATAVATVPSTTEDGSSPPDAGEGTDGQETGGQETEGQGEVAPTAAPPDGAVDGSAEPTATPEAGQPGDQEAGGGTPDMAEATATAEVATPPEGEPAAGDQPEALSPVPLPATHTVAPGENLYRIGLMYGMSWVTLAQYNGLPNANYIYVGQVLNIPGGSGTGGPGVPVNPIEPPPPGFVYHTVRPGENLFRIGLAYGISWIPIAEANGIVNPNQIYAGQVLKIPTNVPGPRPEFTHVVQPGQTLYSISLVYGVSLSAVAQANSIVPPYVIYPGQVLVIPGN